MTPEEAAERLGVPVHTVFELVDTGDLDAHFTGYNGWQIYDRSVAEVARSVDRYRARKAERTRRKDRVKEVVPDYFVRVDMVAFELGVPIHECRKLGRAGAFGARKIQGWWMFDRDQVKEFACEHPDEEYKTARQVLVAIQA